VTPRRIFVTGTDTDVGKTVIAAALTLGLDGCYWKPVQCGTEPETDREAVQRWTELPPDRCMAEAYLLRAPLSPHAAATLEGTEISLERILATPLPADRPLIVEGAGGLLVPLNRNALVADLISGLEMTAVLVARTTLGTLNHTLLTISELRRRGIPLLGVILNGEENVSNRAAIKEYGGVKVLGRIPHLPSLSRASLLEALRGVEFNA
jgi:dethiobiotin synthetase